MSSHTPSDTPPEFDFINFKVLEEKDPSYDPEILAENFLWPLVDAKWEGDFRTDSLPSMPAFCFPKTGTYNGRQLEVILEAGCDVDYMTVQEGESLVEALTAIHDASIRIEEDTPDKLEVLIEFARERDPERVELLVDENDDEPGESLRAVSGFIYYLDSSGGLTGRAYYALKDIDGSELWSSDNGEQIYGYEEDDDEADEDDVDESEETTIDNAAVSMDDSVTINSADIDMLLTAAAILNAPDEIVGYLQKLRRFPEASQ